MIRILFEITAAYFLSSLKKTFLKNYEAYIELVSKDTNSKPIGKVEKMSTEFFKNSDDSGILMEFFKNFDQNTGGKL